MGAAYSLPVIHVRHIDPGPHDIGKGGACGSECEIDVPNSLDSLGVRVARADYPAIRTRGRRTRYVNPFSGANRTGVADDRLPRSTAGNELALVDHCCYLGRADALSSKSFNSAMTDAAMCSDAGGTS